MLAKKSSCKRPPTTTSNKRPLKIVKIKKKTRAFTRCNTVVENMIKKLKDV